MGFNPVDILQKFSSIPGLYFLNTYAQKIWMVFSKVRDKKERALEIRDRVGAAGASVGVKGGKKKEGEGGAKGGRLRGKRSSGSAGTGDAGVAASQNAGSGSGGSPWPDELPDAAPVRVSDDFGRIRGRGKPAKRGEEPPAPATPPPTRERLRKRHER